ncbi:TonB-dependent receptor [Porphyromonadaceae bacterium COT-184 OH4590]|nr:TonB-dependent receptor [Porphyromonadaceae bacterium COT-184 OH4590]
MKKVFVLLLMFSLYSAFSVAQNTVKGFVYDAETDEPLIGVSVQIEGTLNGTQTGLNGEYSLSVNESQSLIFSYIGYETKIVEASKAADVKMKSTSIELKDVTVTSQVAIQRKTPVAVSNITFETIDEKLGNAEFPEVLKSTPGVYTTKSGGGYGDSKIHMRGFKSANIAVMINGVPVNDMEWGGVYWSNWAGLADVTRTMQTQRGLGASKVSAPSVGGSINIITKAHEAKKGGSVQYALGNDGYNKILFNISSGMLDNGWAFTILGSRTWGNGYIQGTSFNGWNYFLNISKIINDDHSLSFTVFGAPQSHYQRSSYDQLTIAEWQRVGGYMKGNSPYKFNPTYGFDSNGQRKSSSFNEYHKPQISLNWNWDMGNRRNLSTVVYASIGRGNGYSGRGGYNLPGVEPTYGNSNWYGTTNGLLNNTFRNPDGTFAYDKIEEINSQSATGSLMAMSKSKNHHNWVGLVSTYTTPLARNIDFYGGIDFRYYKGLHTNELIDLYGGEYFIDESSRRNVKAANNAAAADPNWKMQKLKVGDVVYRDYDGYVMQEGAFAQAEGSFLNRNLNVFVAGSLSNTSYWRYDRFYYDAEHARSETLHFIGYTIKGGANYNINSNHNVFANVGYISRAPYFSGGAFLQSTTSNEVNPKAINENIFSAELGYGFRWKYFSATVNGYFTKWLNKTMARSLDYSYQENGTGTMISDRATINMEGVNARHMGIEVELKATPTRWLELTGMLSFGDWQWDSNPIGYYYNSQGQPLANLTTGEIAKQIGGEDHAFSQLNLKGIKVGGSAQTTYDLGITLKPIKDLRIGMNLNGMSRLFADYNVDYNNLIVNKPYDFAQPWEVPGSAVVNLNASYRFKLIGNDATISGTCQNLFNQIYVADATDGGDGRWQTARVFYGFGRTWTARLRINF